MDLCGTIVRSFKFGEGRVERIRGEHMDVRFPDKVRTFQYPKAFLDFLEVEDLRVSRYIDSELKKADTAMKKHFDRLENERFLKEKQVRINMENEIKRIMQRRGIQYLVHFTRLENVDNILRYGLVPIGAQEALRVYSVHNDEQRMDDRYDCTSLSVSFPNYKLFYKFRQDFKDANWAVLLIDTDVLFSHKNHAYYYQTNAAARSNRYFLSEELDSANAFKEMFASELITKDGEPITRCPYLDSSMTTDPQAEILVSGTIDRKYIKAICFQNEEDKERFTKSRSGRPLYGIDVRTDASFFNKRIDSERWQKGGVR